MSESGCSRDVACQNLEVMGATSFNGGLSLGGNVQAVAVPAADDAAEASSILSTTSIATLTPANGVNDRAYLPSPTLVELGRVVVIVATAACELSAEGDGVTATTINGTAVTNAAGEYAAEVALAAGTYLAIKTGTNAWGLIGAVVAAAD